MRMSASWFGSWTHRIQGRGAIDPRPEKRPLIVIPTAPSVPLCSEQSRCGLARAEYAARLGRRPTLTAPARAGFAIPRVGRRNGPPGRTKKPIKKARCAALKPLDKKRPIQGRGAIDPRPESGLPSDRHPDRTKRAVVLEAVKVWPGKAEYAARLGRRPTLTAPARAGFAIPRVGAKNGPPGRTKKPIKKARCAALNPLDKKPIQGGLHRSAWLRCRQADQGQEAAYSGRYTGLLLHAIVHAADVQDRDGGLLLLATLFGKFPFLEKLFADSAYQGPIFAGGLAELLPFLKTEIINRSDRASGFVQLPKRWIVEHTIAWLNRCRRLAKDWENLNCSGLAYLKLASIRLMLRKLCNP
jgi:transposase